MYDCLFAHLILLPFPTSCNNREINVTYISYFELFSLIEILSQLIMLIAIKLCITLKDFN